MTPFRNRSALRQWELRFGPNMTPMVDIVMVILVFFMASAAFVGPEFFLRSALPRTGGAAPAASDPFALPPATFDLRLFLEGGRTLVRGLGGRTLSLDEFEAELASLASGGAAESMIVLVTPDDDVPYRDVVRVHDACARAGVTNAGLAR